MPEPITLTKKTCWACKGEGATWRRPWKTSPPSLNRPDNYDGYGNVPMKQYMPCDECGGRGYDILCSCGRRRVDCATVDTPSGPHEDRKYGFYKE